MLFAKKSFTAAPRAVQEALHRRVGRSAAQPDAARQWLVFAGQIEQAVRDQKDGEEVQRLTDCAADVFLQTLRGGDAEACRQRLLADLEALRLPEGAASFRIPEGFAWYALYPESYAEAAARWRRACWRGEPVLVIGLRSIGTALSAVVARALSAAAVPARRVTLRPRGHPFARGVELTCEVGAAERVIVVDEGPGLSGSSLAGTAEALRAAGVPDEAIAFFPGHDRGPGAMASATVRAWWSPERCWTGEAPGGLLPPEPALRWVFGGFAAVNAELDTLAEIKQARQARLAARGLACLAPAMAHGWIGIAEEGSPLDHHDLSPALLAETLAPYIAAAAQPGGDAATAETALQRIADAMSLPGVPQRVQRACRGLALAGDGRMAPGEWLRNGDGLVLKRDATGTDCDHSWAGQQSILWDVAGALVEWRMTQETRSALLLHLRARHGLAVEPLALAFHEAGYCSLQRARAAHEGDEAAARRFEARMRQAMTQVEALQ